MENNFNQSDNSTVSELESSPSGNIFASSLIEPGDVTNNYSGSGSAPILGTELEVTNLSVTDSESLVFQQLNTTTSEANQSTTDLVGNQVGVNAEAAQESFTLVKGDNSDFPTSRDPYKWPFAQDSIWNMPIGSDAVYVPAGIGASSERAVTADDDIIIMTPDAPLTPVYTNHEAWGNWTAGARCSIQGDVITHLPIPTDFEVPHFPGTPNVAAAVLMPDGRTIHQSQPFHRCEAGGHATSKFVYPEDDIFTGDGIQGAHGGAGMSSLGGTIRLGELVPGGEIHHALKVNIFAQEYMAYNNDSTPGYRWPAVKADSYAQGVYGGSVPALEMGALLALKPNFDINSLNTEPARIIAQAFMDYGGYVVDDTFWDVYALETEWSPDGVVTEEFQDTWGFKFNEKDLSHPWSEDMRDIFTSLHVIDNNSPDSVGGGGTPRKPLAPPFIGEESTPTPLEIPVNPQPQPDTNQEWKIMPLGDSLTEGNYPNGHHSYRGYLRTMLLDAGYEVDFVGDRSSQAHGDTNPADGDHAGHGGYTIGPDDSRFCSSCETANLYDHIEEYMESDPDVVLLNIGVNDMFPGSNRPVEPSEADDKLENLVDRILEIDPDTKVLVSSLMRVSWTDGSSWGAYQDVNERARALGEADPNDQIYFVDLNSVPLAGNDFFDAIHLSGQGAKKIASEWFDTLTPILQGKPMPQEQPPTEITFDQPKIDGDIVYLSDLEWTSATNGWGDVERDLSNGENNSGDGNIITLNGVTYEKGLGVHANSEITFDLAGEYELFKSDIGIDDEVNNGSVRFRVYVDGLETYTSQVMGANSETESLSVDVTGAQQLRLVVDDGGDNFLFDHGDWANAQLIPLTPEVEPDLETVYLSDLEWTSATNGWGAVERDLSNGENNSGDGNIITLNGVTYEKGLGVHANSEITFDLAGEYELFKSDIGIDDEVNDGSVRFQVYVDGVEAYTSPLMESDSDTESISVEVKGAEQLRLVVDDGGDNFFFDHADWANAKLLRFSVN